MGTAASGIPLEFGADPGVGGCLGAAGDVSVATPQMFARLFMQMFARRSSCRVIGVNTSRKSRSTL